MIVRRLTGAALLAAGGVAVVYGVTMYTRVKDSLSGELRQFAHEAFGAARFSEGEFQAFAIMAVGAVAALIGIFMLFQRKHKRRR